MKALGIVMGIMSTNSLALGFAELPEEDKAARVTKIVEEFDRALALTGFHVVPMKKGTYSEEVPVTEPVSD